GCCGGDGRRGDRRRLGAETHRVVLADALAGFALLLALHESFSQTLLLRLALGGQKGFALRLDGALLVGEALPFLYKAAAVLGQTAGFLLDALLLGEATLFFRLFLSGQTLFLGTFLLGQAALVRDALLFRNAA